MFKSLPNFKSFKRFTTSPNWTCELTTPSLNSCLYLSLACGVLVPTCNIPNASLKASATTLGFSKNIPFEAENAVAENKFLKWVTGAKTVLATWAKPFGVKIKFL